MVVPISMLQNGEIESIPELPSKKTKQIKFTGYGKDLPRFLAAVSNRAKKCRWNSILTFGTKNLIKHYGEIELDVRDQTTYTTLRDARPKIDSQMMFHFLFDSLGQLPQKKLSTKLDEIAEDGPTLLKVILLQTFVATQSATFTIKEKFYDLNLKKFKWNVHSLNQDVREKMADLQAAGHASDKTDVMITLFRAYNTSTNDDFTNAVSFWRNEWSSGTIKDVEDLMMKADSKYSELRDMGTWGKRSPKDDQIVALTSQIQALKKGKDSKSGSSDKNTKHTAKWRTNKSESTTDSLNKNGKSYRWCDGPGHNGIGMWVLHEPGKCTKDYNKGSNANSGSKDTDKTENKFDRKAFTSYLKDQGHADEEVDSKLSVIFAVMES